MKWGSKHSDAILIDIFKFMSRKSLELKIRPVCRHFTRIVEGEATESVADFSTPFHVISCFSIINSFDGCNTRVELNGRSFLFNHFCKKLGGHVPSYLRFNRFKITTCRFHKYNEIEKLLAIIEPLLPAWRQCYGENVRIADICMRGTDLSILFELLAIFYGARILRVSLNGTFLRMHAISTSQFFEMPTVRDCAVLQLDPVTALEFFSDERNVAAAIPQKRRAQRSERRDAENANGNYSALLEWLHPMTVSDDGFPLPSQRRQIVVRPELCTNPSATAVLRQRLVEIFENARTPQTYELNIGGMQSFPYLCETHFNKWTGEELEIKGRKRTYKITRRLRGDWQTFVQRTVPLLVLPSETLVDVFSFLDRHQLEVSLAGVCRRFCNLIRIAMAARPPFLSIRTLDITGNVLIDRSESIPYDTFRKVLLPSVPSYLRIVKVNIKMLTPRNVSVSSRRFKAHCAMYRDIMADTRKFFGPFERSWCRNPVKRLHIILPSRESICRVAPYLLNELTVNEALKLSFVGECAASELFIARRSDVDAGDQKVEYYADVVDDSRASIFHTACVHSEALRELTLVWVNERDYSTPKSYDMPDVHCFMATDVLRWLHHAGDLPSSSKDFEEEIEPESHILAMSKCLTKRAGGRHLWMRVRNSSVDAKQLRDLLVEEFLRDTTPRTYVFKWEWIPKFFTCSTRCILHHNRHTGETLRELIGDTSQLQLERFMKPTGRVADSLNQR